MFLGLILINIGRDVIYFNYFELLFLSIFKYKKYIKVDNKISLFAN